jgi:hypothetical protein
MNLFNKQVLKINDRLFIIKKVLHQDICKDIDLLKQWSLADSVFKKEDMMYFCEAIVDLEPEQDIQEPIKIQEHEQTEVTTS